MLLAKKRYAAHNIETMKILTLGGATQDIFTDFKTETMDLASEHEQATRCFLMFEAGKKVEIQSIAYHTGGGATNAAVSFKRLGFDTQSFFKIGNDPQGEFILKELAAYGINLTTIPKSLDTPTAISIIIPCPSGDRTILAYRGATRTLTQAELPLAAIAECDQLYVTSLSSVTAPLLIPITAHAKKHKKMVAANPGSSQLQAGADHLRQALPNIDILILNNYEASLLMASLIQTDAQLQQKVAAVDRQQKTEFEQKLMQSPMNYREIYFTLEQFCTAVLESGPRIVVVTNGAEGVYVATKNSLLFHPSQTVEVTSSVGAGDAFGSCFVGCLLLGKTIEDAMRCGILNAASVITHVGAKAGLLTIEQLEKKLEILDTNLLKRLLG